MANMWKKVERIEMKRYQDAAKALHPRGGGGGGGGSSRSEEQVYQALTNETRHEDVNYASLKKTEENDLANNKGESVEPQGILKSSPPPSRDSSIKIHCSAVVCVTVSVMGGVVVILLAAALAVLSVEVFSHSSLTGSPSNGPFLSSIMGQLRRLNQTLSAMNKQQNNHSAALEELRTLSSFLENTSLRNAKTLEAEQKRIQDVWVTVNNTDLRTSALSGNTLLMNCSTTTTNKSIPILAFFNNGLYSISVLTSFEVSL